MPHTRFHTVESNIADVPITMGPLRILNPRNDSKLRASQPEGALYVPQPRASFRVQSRTLARLQS